jgi:predicted DNA-binding ribbon-helix-helix protein
MPSAARAAQAQCRKRRCDLKSAVVKRSIVVAGHKTSVSLEDAFWQGLKDIAKSRDMTLSDIVGYIDGHRENGNLSSTIRLFVLEYARAQLVAQAERAALPQPQRLATLG